MINITGQIFPENSLKTHCKLLRLIPTNQLTVQLTNHPKLYKLFQLVTARTSTSGLKMTPDREKHETCAQVLQKEKQSVH